MSISSVSSAPVRIQPPVQQAPKSNDHDSDDGVASAPATPAPAAPGTGTAVDKTA